LPSRWENNSAAAFLALYIVAYVFLFPIYPTYTVFLWLVRVLVIESNDFSDVPY
jgi:hypothetical protein